jgi:hypothetical protein
VLATTKERVRQYLVANQNKPYCDFCLMKAIGARERQIVQRATSRLSVDQPASFKRREVLCSNSNQSGHLPRVKLCITYVGSGSGAPPHAGTLPAR